MTSEKMRRIVDYQDAYLADYGFEAVMVAARQRMGLDVIQSVKPDVVVEIGCGLDMLSRHASSRGIVVQDWIVVEPAPEFASAAHAARAEGVPITIIEGFLEDVVERVQEQARERSVLAICSGVLHEVPEPRKLLDGIRRLLQRSGVLHLNVPNALSLHRRIARAMKLIQDEHDLSHRNRSLNQPRVYDRASLRAELADMGFEIQEEGGYFLKPFTHVQMQSMMSIIQHDVLDGLWEIGRELPELASEIYVNATSVRARSDGERPLSGSA